MPITHIDIESKKVAKKSRRPPWWKILLVVVGSFVLVTSIATMYLYPKVRVLAKDVEKVSNQARAVQTNIEKQDVALVKDEFLQLRKDLKKTQTDLSQLAIIGKLPLLNAYYNDAKHALKAGIFVTQAGEIVTDSIVPFVDILGLKGVKSNLKAEKKVEVLVTKVFPELSSRTGDMEALVKKIKAELSQISESRYPKALKINGAGVYNSITQAKELVNKTEKSLPLLKTASEALPSILGYKKEKTYLLWFQNDKELRPTGGFITAYGVVKVKNGKLVDITSDDIYDLDKRFSPFETPPAPLQKYLLLKIFPIRDTNISPDFDVSVKKFESFYERISNVPKIDGIIAVDTEMVRRFLEITGPVTVQKYNETFSAEDHPIYKIPDVIYKLELYAEVLLRGSNERKGLVGDLMDEMLKKLFAAPAEKFPTIFDTFVTSAESKNILFNFKDKNAQELVEELNYAGRIKSYDGDYLHVNNANFAGLKGNLYIKALVEQDIVVSGEGEVTKKVKVTLRNTEKADGWLNAVYQNWMRLYVPKGSKLIDKEVFADFGQGEDLGKTVWESFSRTLPLSFSETSFTYKLPFKVKKGQTYRLLIQKQGGTTDPYMIIRVNGKKLFEFDLKKDTKLEFKI